MPVSEHDLRDLLRDRSTAVPTPPDLAHRVQERVRRRRRLEAGAGIGVLVIALVATGLVVVPRRDAAPPASTAPTHRTTQVIGSTLVVTTEGPTRIDGEAPFDVRLEVTNTGSSTWTGMAGVGLVTGGEVPGFIGENPLVVGADGDAHGGPAQGPAATQGPAALTDRSSAQQWYGLSVPSVRLEPGQSGSWTMRMKRDPSATVLDPVLGWSPWLDPDGSDTPSLYGSLGDLAPVAVTPRASDRACDSVTITSASVGPLGPWQLTDVSRAVVGPDLRATWLALDVPDAPIPSVDARSGDARETTVMAAVSRYLNDTATPIPATGYASSGDVPQPTEQKPGTYIYYSAARMADVSYTGTCGPSGQAISGTWSAYARTTDGELDCRVVPPSGDIALDARRYCKL